MTDRNYWLDLFTYTTWQEFLEAGGQVFGFRDGRWNIVRQVQPGYNVVFYRK